MANLRTFEELHPYLLNEDALRTLEMDELMTILENYDYYLKPSKQKELFKKTGSILLLSRLTNMSKYHENLIKNKFIELIRDSFDRSFYNIRIKSINKVESESLTQKLYKEMEKLKTNELVKLIVLIIEGRMKNYLFIKSCDNENFHEKLAEIGHRINPEKIQLLTEPIFLGNTDLCETLCCADRNELLSVIKECVTKDYLLLIKLIRKCFGNNHINISNFIKKEVI